MPGPPGTPPPADRVTIRDVAAATGVHPATVSRALAAKLVSQATRERVEDAARRLGYVPHPAASSLRGRRTRTVGLLADLSDPLLLPGLHGAEQALREAGYTLLVASPTGAARADPVASMRDRADGLIIAGGPESLAAAAVSAGMPVVIAGYASRTLPSAGPDLAEAAGLAAGHLAALGHAQVACLSGPGAPLSRQLLTAAARQAGLTVPDRLIAETAALTAGEAQRWCQRVFAGGPACTAILAGSDILAAGCCAALAAVGRSCPAEVSVTGAGDLPLAASLTPPLTTVRLYETAVGAAAARILLARLDGGDGAPSQTTTVHPELAVRKSTTGPPGR